MEGSLQAAIQGHASPRAKKHLRQFREESHKLRNASLLVTFVLRYFLAGIRICRIRPEQS
jgi:hypothetical protein